MDEPLEVLDIPALRRYTEAAVDVMGREWFRRKLQQEQERRQRSSRSSGNRKYFHTTRPLSHPMIEWDLERIDWLKACLQSNKIETSQNVIKFASLGQALEKASKQEGFQRLFSRLRSPTGFHAAAFEAEMAVCLNFFSPAPQW